MESTDERQDVVVGETVRWGILATGKIAHTFATDLRLVQGARLAAVGSRSLESAQRFALEHAADGEVATAYGSYEELATVPDVDVVYVASPHGLHLEHVRLLLEAGKPVLCEKPLTLNLGQAEALVGLARERGVFLMEAMWMSCHPLMRHVRDRVAAGDFGSPVQVVADLGWLVDLPPTDRMFAPELGGGALLDMGVYVLTFARMFLGDPARLSATAALNEHGIDLNVAIAAGYDSGAVAALTTTMTGHSPRTASIATDTGRLDFPAPFHHPGSIVWTPFVDGRLQQPEKILAPQPVLGAGYGNEAREVMRCLRAGELESPMVPHEQTLAVMGQLDDLRRQLGIVYPGE